jgi:NAD(P)-dependent dehydrogenase (short-subunit alcohol dehydrogenase family)
VTDVGRYVFHPAVADACGHVLTAAVPVDAATGKEGAFVGGGIAELRVYRRPRGTRLTSWARVRRDVVTSDHLLIGDVFVVDESGALIRETRGARLYYLDATEAASPVVAVDDWLHELGWEHREHGAAPRANAVGAGSWLILADASGVGDALAAALEARGEHTVLARVGEVWRRIDERTYELRVANREDVGRLLDDAFPSARGCRGIVHLWSVDAAPEPSISVAALERAQLLGSGTALAVVQELLARHWPPGPASWFVTRGALRIGAGPGCAFAQAPLWGFARSLATEASRIWGGVVDLDPVAPVQEAAASLVSEVLEPDEDDQIAYRAGERFVARLRRLSFTQAAPLRWRPDGAYLITGGLGGLALEVARWMAEQGARRLILLNRTPLPPRSRWRDALAHGGRTAERIAAVRELEAMGANVEVVAIDVADEARLTEFLDTWRSEQRPPIRGIVHTAGVMQYEALGDHTCEAMSEIMRAKVIGGWLLHHLFRHEPLDFFVLFSSASSILSSPLIGSYAGANSFLDALAHHRAALDKPALAVNWGLWSGVGMAAAFASDHKATRQQGATITPKQGIDALERLMASRVTQAMVSPIRWNQWARLYPGFAQAPLLRDLVAEGDARAVPPRVAPAASLTRESLLGHGDDDRATMLNAYVAEQVGAVLGVAPETLEVDHPITAMGLDSLMAVELKTRFENTLGLAVPVVQFLEGPTVQTLAAILLDRLPSSAANGSSNIPSVAAILDDDVEEGRI